MIYSARNFKWLLLALGTFLTLLITAIEKQAFFIPLILVLLLLMSIDLNSIVRIHDRNGKGFGVIKLIHKLILLSIGLNLDDYLLSEPSLAILRDKNLTIALFVLLMVAIIIGLYYENKLKSKENQIVFFP